MHQHHLATLEAAFRRHTGDGLAPEYLVSAPARVNLIGEHTDYNDGFVLPIAIDRHVHAACRRRDDRTVRVVGRDVDAAVSFSLDGIERDAEQRWSNYVRGCAAELQEAGVALVGMDVAVGGDAPVAAGVSSSAAIELASAQAFLSCAGVSMPLPDLALLCQRVENQFVGVGCGIMDQYISAMGRGNHAMLLDCESLTYRLVPTPAATAFVVCDTRKARELGDSAYNERRGQCEVGAARLGVKSLRHATMAQLEAARSTLDEVVWRRCRHVITEIDRTLEAADLLEAGDVEGFGRLMDASHASLRDDYEVSCRELDVMVEAAREAPGCHGARLTGAGFGGCAVAMVDREHVAAFIEQTTDTYRRATELDPVLYGVVPSQGVTVTGL